MGDIQEQSHIMKLLNNPWICSINEKTFIKQLRLMNAAVDECLLLFCKYKGKKAQFGVAGSAVNLNNNFI